MAKCPKCKKTIKYLEFEYNTIEKGVAIIDPDGDLDAAPTETEMISEKYFCPKCGKRLDIEDPAEFLTQS